jgi:hypothetical protein
MLGTSLFGRGANSGSVPSTRIDSRKSAAAKTPAAPAAVKAVPEQELVDGEQAQQRRYDEDHERDADHDRLADGHRAEHGGSPSDV